MPRYRSQNRREVDLEDEIRTHFEMAIAERMARGESCAQAERAVRREFGDPGRVKEATRESWGRLWIDRLGQDLRIAFRSLRRQPGVSLTVVLTLSGWAIGLGLAAGLAGGYALSRVLQSQLFEVEPFDPLLYALAAGILAGTALMASLLPARTATRIDPMTTLKEV